MSRIGRKPIPVPDTVTVTIEPEVVRVAGPRGNLEERKARAIDVKQEDGSLIVTRNTAKNPVALLFAGGQTSTFANPIGPVLQAVQGTIVSQ